MTCTIKRPFGRFFLGDTMEDRITTAYDDKQRILDLTSFKFQAPSVGIYDEPVRCYKANIQWAKIIEGMLDWLTEIAAWKDSQDESYIGIQEMLKFLEGIDCAMTPIDCEDIENCLETSETINNINNSIENVGNNVSGGYDPTNYDKPFADGKYYQDSQTNAFVPSNGCDDNDKDALWGAIDSLIDYIDAKNLDFLQQMAQSISLSDGVQKAIELTPLVELLPPANLVDLTRWYLQFVVNGYLSEFTVDDKREIKCAIFCAVVDSDCSLSLQDVISYIEGEFTAVAAADSIEDLLIILAGLISISGKEWFYAVTSLQLALAVMGEVYVRRDTIATYNKYIQAGALSPSRVWSVYCDTCESPPSGWTAVFDFTGFYSALPGEIVYRPPFNFGTLGAQGAGSSAELVIGQGLIFDHPPSSGALRRQLNFASTVNFTNFQIRARSLNSGTCRVGLNTSGAGSIVLGFDLPNIDEESSIFTNQIGSTTLWIQGENRVSTVYWRFVIEWIKISQIIGNPTNPPVLI